MASSSSCRFIDRVCKFFRLNKLHEHQEEVMKYIQVKKDVFLSVKTEGRKNLCYHNFLYYRWHSTWKGKNYCVSTIVMYCLVSLQPVTTHPVIQLQEFVRLMEATAKQQEKLMTWLSKLEKQGVNQTQRPRYNNNNSSKLECYY